MRIGIVVPHIFMHREILPHVIFSPGTLAIDLANGLSRVGIDVTLFTPGPVDTLAHNVVADLHLFERELALRNDTYVDLLKKHPFTFVTLARQVQSEIIARAFTAANRNQLDLVHIYTNEEDIALPYAQLCTKPVVFTHHDPFNFLIKYKNIFPKYAHLNWLSISRAQRLGMPSNTNWVGIIYHGLSKDTFTPNYTPPGDYIASLGRIVEPKGVHLAIEAIKQYNQARPANHKLRLKIAGKHYSGSQKDTYWQQKIAPYIDGDEVEYIGFIKTIPEKQAFLGNARAVLMPSLFDEPFGMVAIESLACGTPVVGLDSGSLPELIKAGHTGIIVKKIWAKRSPTDKPILSVKATAAQLAAALANISQLDRRLCRQDFEAHFTLERMCQEHAQVYEKLITK